MHICMDTHQHSYVVYRYKGLRTYIHRRVNKHTPTHISDHKRETINPNSFSSFCFGFQSRCVPPFSLRRGSNSVYTLTCCLVTRAWGMLTCTKVFDFVDKEATIASPPQIVSFYLYTRTSVTVCTFLGSMGLSGPKGNVCSYSTPYGFPETRDVQDAQC